MTTAVSPREGQFAVTPAMTIYYDDYAGETGNLPVVCLHGYWRTARDFAELGAHLAPAHRVIVPDLRGRGRSSRSTDDRDYDLDLLVDDVARLLEHLGVQRAVFVGLALGAQISMLLANRNPELVAGIVFNDSGPESKAAAGHRMKAFAGAEELTREEAMARVKAQYQEAFPRMTEEGFERLLYRNYAVTAESRYVRDFDQLTNVALMRTKEEHPTFWPEYDSIGAIPILIVRGENSDFLTPDIVERMLAGRPQARLASIPDCGHPSMMWEPETYAAIESLLNEVAR